MTTFTYHGMTLRACLFTLILLTPISIDGDTSIDDFVQLVDTHAVILDEERELDPLLEAIGDRRFVLLGESTHGTHEYYHWRDIISRRLIVEKEFGFVAVEGDWKAIHRINQYVRHRTEDGVTARDVLNQLSRWPTWLWANEEFEIFVEWLRDHNAGLSPDKQVGLYGLDMQDPADSLQEVRDWFAQNKPEESANVAGWFDCFAEHVSDPRAYLNHLALGGGGCGDQLQQPVHVLRASLEEASDVIQAKDIFAAKQNALIVASSEMRYRSMLQGDAESWNIRARHFHDTFVRLAGSFGPESRGIVWAHNTHVGDSRHTSMRIRGEVNIGELIRDSAGPGNVFILGFGSHRGTVIAGPQWGGPTLRMRLVDSQPGTVESLFAGLDRNRFLIIFDEAFRREAPSSALAQRAVGVVYAPPNEAYVPSLLHMRYDAFIFIEETRALAPIHSLALGE